MTKCTFHKFGTSGNIEKHDALCILPLNIGENELVNESWEDYTYFSKRENLHLYLVLVAIPGIPLESGHCLQNRDSLQPLHQSIRAQTQIQVRNHFILNGTAGTKNIVWRNPDFKTNIYFTVLIRLLELSEFLN